MFYAHLADHFGPSILPAMSDKVYIETFAADRVESDVEMQDLSDSVSKSKLNGTSVDEYEMRILGKTQQLNVSTAVEYYTVVVADMALQRNFRFISTLGFACTLMSTWEISLM